MIPTPVAVDEQLPEPEVACSLLAQSVVVGSSTSGRNGLGFPAISSGAANAGADTRRGS